MSAPLPEPFFPFPDRSLTYDCVTCVTKCCHKGLIVMNARDQATLLPMYPFLRYSCTHRKDELYVVERQKPCWFFEGGRCGIHAQHGAAAKPLVCRIHPFYVEDYGGTPVVTVTGDDSCGIRVCRPGESGGIAHDALRPDVEDAVRSRYFIATVAYDAERLAAERRLLDDARAFAGRTSYVDFAAHQLERAGLGVTVDQLWQRWQDYFGVEVARENASIAHEMTVLTPLLRLKSMQYHHVEQERLPVALLALYFYALLSSGPGDVRGVPYYLAVLRDVPAAMARLDDEDMKVGAQAVEAKLEYLRNLNTIHRQLALQAGAVPQL